jgi:hypothetical protein
MVAESGPPRFQNFWKGPGVPPLHSDPANATANVL